MLHRFRHSLGCAAALLIAVLLIAGCGGSAKPSRKQATAATGWSVLDLASAFAQKGGNVVSVSCTTGPFCMILEANPTYTTWQTVTYDRGKLGTAQTISGGAAGEQLACASARYCVAYAPGAPTQSYSVWNGTRWGAAHKLAFKDAPSGTGLTCPATNLCLAIGANGSDGKASTLVFTQLAVAEAPFANHRQTLSSVVCASATDCYIVGNQGGVWHLAGLHSTWTGPVAVSVADASGADDPVTEISCTGGPYCVGIGTGGGVVTSNGAGFHKLAGVTVDGGEALSSFSGSCGDKSFCLVQTSAGSGYAILNGSTLTPVPKPPAQPAGGLSCTADRFCMDDLATSSAKVIIYRGA